MAAEDIEIKTKQTIVERKYLFVRAPVTIILHVFLSMETFEENTCFRRWDNNFIIPVNCMNQSFNIINSMIFISRQKRLKKTQQLLILLILSFAMVRSRSLKQKRERI